MKTNKELINDAIAPGSEKFVPASGDYVLIDWRHLLKALDERETPAEPVKVRTKGEEIAERMVVLSHNESGVLFISEGCALAIKSHTGRPPVELRDYLRAVTAAALDARAVDAVEAFAGAMADSQDRNDRLFDSGDTKRFLAHWDATRNAPK